ncbi:MAG: hypothetical protein WC996_09685 [Peptostreptococcales bacterium]
MGKYNFLLDTNAYRDLVYGRNSLEFQKEIRSIKLSHQTTDSRFIFSSIVCIELINHLSETDPAKTECFKALNYQVNLCSTIKNQRARKTLVPEFNELLSLYFFKKNSTHFNLNNNLYKLAFEISSSNGYNDLKTFKDRINEVIQYKNSELENIIFNIENYLLKGISNKQNNWEIFRTNQTLKDEFIDLIEREKLHKLYALALVKLTFDKEKINLADLTENQFKQFNSDFKLSIDFFIKEILKKLVDINKMEYFFLPDTDPNNRWNSFYDSQIIMACEFENNKGRKTKLVTSDHKILNHFKNHKREDWCISLDDFSKQLIKES